MIHQRFEEEYLRATKEAEKIEAVLGGLTKKNQAQVLFFISGFGNSLRFLKYDFYTNYMQESAYDVTIEDLFNATVKLEEKEKVYSNAEGEVIKYLEHKNILNCIPFLLPSCSLMLLLWLS